MIRIRFVATGVLVVLCAWPVASGAQQVTAFAPIAGAQAFAVFDAQPLESLESVKGAPFTAEAVTEFTQILSDGNRIERNFRTTIARDGRGRTRREQEIALLGPLAQLNDTPTHVVTISDPEDGVHYTLDDRHKTAFKSRAAVHVSTSLGPGHAGVDVGAALAGATVDVRRLVGPDGSRVEWTAQGAGNIAFTGAIAGQFIGGAPFEASVAAPGVTTQSLGTSQIEGVTAEGTRTTMTIPAGAVGNIGPIEVVTERWFSQELQMAVQITRRDPRSGDTVYRLTNIVRAEPPADLFMVPPDYQVHDPETMFHNEPRVRITPGQPR